jgi:glycosyltransferase involved in cell wall biosynthesis
MNLLIIPSWYPNSVQPIAGIFTREQAEALADLAPDVRVMVSTWGHDAGALTLRRVRKSLTAMRWRLAQRDDQVTVHMGVNEIFNPTLTWSPRLPFGGIRRLLEVNRKNVQLAIKTYGGVDLMHAHVSYPAGYVASVLSCEFGIPYVLTEHMSPFPFLSLMRQGRPVPEIDQAFAFAAATIAVSPSLAETIASFAYVAPCVIPNVVDERRFAPGSPCAEKFVFFTLCSLFAQKGIDHLLHAIAHWNPPPDCFEFRIGGDGPMRTAYQALARDLGVADRVRWLGPVSREDAPKLFKACHVYVMPSRHETFGVVFAEAIATGKPVIATRCGGPEFIVNDTNGMLVAVGDVPGLSVAMQAMAGNWGHYSPLAIRKDFEQRFSRPAVVANLLSLYRRALKEA